MPPHHLSRRDFLRLGASAVAAAGLGERLYAQPRALLEELRIGLTAPFTGAAAGLGIECYRGAMAGLAEINGAGGIAGRRIVLIARDDGGESERAARNVARLVDNDRVLCMLGGAGSAAALGSARRVLRRAAGAGVFLVGSRLDALPSADGELVDFLPPLEAEVAGLVGGLWRAGARRFGILYPLDGLGRWTAAAAQEALSELRGEAAVEATLRRDAVAAEEIGAAISHLRAATVDAVICATTYAPCAALVREAGAAGWSVPIGTLSTVGAEALRHRLTGLDPRPAPLIAAHGVPAFNGIGAAGAEPSGAADYRSAMDKWAPAVPGGLATTDYRPAAYSFVGFAAFLASRRIADASRPGISPAELRQAVNGSDKRDTLYYTRLEGDSWTTVDEWTPAVLT